MTSQQAVYRLHVMPLNGYWLTGVGALMHFLVDGLCVCCLYLMLFPFTVSLVVGVFMVYNILAFLTQPLTGLVADHIRHPHWLLVLSVALLALAVLGLSVVTSVASFRMSLPALVAVALLLGLGNSLFHVWGGRLSAVRTGNDMRALGVFVAPGAFGLAVGCVFFSWVLLCSFLLSFSLLAAAIVMTDGETKRMVLASDHSSKAGRTVKNLNLIILALLALMAFVMFRSFVGEGFTSAVTPSNGSVLAIGAIAMMGKMAGAWLVRGMGLVMSMVLVVAAVTLCRLAASGGNIAVLMGGLFLVNCTMPVTLYLANVVLPGREGLAFGLLAAALVPGYLLAML